MSRQQLEDMIAELRAMPEAEKQQVCELIAALKPRKAQPAPETALPPGLEWDGGFLVFTGEVMVDDPVKFQRGQRLQELIGRVLG